MMMRVLVSLSLYVSLLAMWTCAVGSDVLLFLDQPAGQNEDGAR